jgi:hypothetical protein
VVIARLDGEAQVAEHLDGAGPAALANHVIAGNLAPCHCHVSSLAALPRFLVDYMSKTMSVRGLAQQMSTWPSVGGSSGSGA